MQREFTIERLGHQGDGVAAGPVFAPRALPGETVSGVLDGDRLTDIRIVTPSPDRVRPPCRHYKACGGCQLQHAADGFVAGWKQEFVRASLSAQGIDTQWRPLVTSPPQSRRRATLAARRTKKGALVGFHGRASDVITEIPDCHLLHPDLMAGLPMIEALTTLAGSRKGTLTVAVTVSRAGLDIAVSGRKPLDGPLQRDLGMFAESHMLARLAWGGEVIAMRAAPIQRFGRADVVPPPGAFLQATAEGEAALVSGVGRIVGDAARVVDLFAGCGTFALPLAETGEIHAVEGDSGMIDALDRGWRRATGLKRVTTEVHDLFRRPLAGDELARFDAAVIDPPRAGAAAQVAALADAGIARIAYVSCNPISFARDARSLTDNGYALDWVQVVDQFRWSVHTELVAAFRRVA